MSVAWQGFPNRWVWARLNPSDINEHVETLARYAAECEHITEFGVRRCVSTVALLHGLPENGVMVSYDTVITAEALMLEKLDPRWAIVQGNTILTIGTIAETDLLFIDTVHTYIQVLQELTHHAHKVRKYLIFHDVVTFGTCDEGNNRGPGIMPAIAEYMASHPEWKTAEMFENNNGLLILKRV